jgi:hypothetical protein
MPPITNAIPTEGMLRLDICVVELGDEVGVVDIVGLSKKRTISAAIILCIAYVE